MAEPVLVEFSGGGHAWYPRKTGGANEYRLFRRFQDVGLGWAHRIEPDGTVVSVRLPSNPSTPGEAE